MSKKSYCDRVKCGSSNPKCRPEYCYNTDKSDESSSRNWGYCNMTRWYRGKNKKNLTRRQKRLKKNFEKKCVKELKDRTRKGSKTRLGSKSKIRSVDVNTLHRKMPYIWRFLRPSTRRHMVDLALKPVAEINIKGSIFDKTDRHTKGFKTLRKKYRSI